MEEKKNLLLWFYHQDIQDSQGPVKAQLVLKWNIFLLDIALLFETNW